MNAQLRLLALATFLTSGLALAGAKPPLPGVINAVDAKAGTVTLQMNDGTTATYKAEGKAAAKLASLASGEKVMVTFRDQPAGTHAAVTSIHAEAAQAA